MEPLDPRLREVIDRGMRAALPDDATQARSLARLLSALPIVPGPDPGSPMPEAAAAAVTGKVSLKIVVVALLASAAIASTATLLRAPEDVEVSRPPVREAPSHATSEPPPTIASTPEPKSVVDMPAIEPEPALEPIREPWIDPPANTKRPPRARSTPARDDDALLVETGLVAAASAALERGDAKAALAVLREHAQRFPNGQLALERRGLELAARCVIDPSATRGDAEDFLRRHGRSSAAAKVRARCE